MLDSVPRYLPRSTRSSKYSIVLAFHVACEWDDSFSTAYFYGVSQLMVDMCGRERYCTLLW